MQNLLMEKLRAYIAGNNPDLLVSLQGNFSVTQYLEDKVALAMPMVEQLIAEGKPSYIIEELSMNELTADLRPSKFNYIKNILEEEFADDYKRLAETGVLTYEIINLIETCKEVFETFEFSEANEDDRFLRYAIIAELHDYLN